MPTVFLGNTAVIATFGEAQAVAHSGDEAPPSPDNVVPRPELGQQVTRICPPADISTPDQAEAVVAAYAACSKEAPAWVEGDDEELGAAVAHRYGCPVGCPDNGDPDKHNHDTWKES